MGPMRRLRFVVGAVLVVLLGAATGEPGSRAPDPRTVGGLSLISQQVGTQLTIYTQGRDIGFWTGINVGSTTPGHHPGELSVSAEEWRGDWPSGGH